MAQFQMRSNAARYLADDAAEDILDRLSFLRHAPGRALVIGTQSDHMAAGLKSIGAEVISAERTGKPAAKKKAPAKRKSA